MRRLCRLTALLLALALLPLGGCARRRNTGLLPVATLAPTSAAASLGEESSWGDQITYEGVTYRPRRGIKTVLFLGVDKTRLDLDGDASLGNNGRADSLMLFILEEQTETVQTLAISRDTITEVDVYKRNGDFAYSGPEHINMQYAFGNSDKRSCFLTARTVSDLLYGTKIDGYVALTVDGISTVVDRIGGVTLTLTQDYPELGAQYVQGATLTLDGAEAERFVRYRDLDLVESNDLRMERQEFFMQSLFRQMKASAHSESEMNALMEDLDGVIQSNLDAETLKKLATYSLREESEKVPGESVAGEHHYEYHVDEEALRALVIRLFYEPVS